MTPEQIQSAIDGLRANFEKTDRGLSGWLEGIGATVADHRQLYLSILTQALEIAKGDKVVVDKDDLAVLDKIIENYKSHSLSSIYQWLIHIRNNLRGGKNKAMIAVAEGDK
jgi:hypothetical protein